LSGSTRDLRDVHGGPSWPVAPYRLHNSATVARMRAAAPRSAPLFKQTDASRESDRIGAGTSSGSSRASRSGQISRTSSGQRRNRVRGPRRRTATPRASPANVQDQTCSTTQVPCGRTMFQLRSGQRPAAVPLGVVGNESTGVSFNVDAAARQLASSSLVFVPTSLSSAPWSSISQSWPSRPPRRAHRQRVGYRSRLFGAACARAGSATAGTWPFRPQTKRDGREVPPHDARRVGLRAHLPVRARPHRRLRGLAPTLQPPGVPHCPPRRHADEPCHELP
jgi:hypothetical protein